jgi:catechol 2,3-dioxygenase-like lactoylglutathione lyase family enzyme
MSEEPVVDMKLEVIVIPVSDVDRALAFYRDLGWRLDADFAAGPDFRVVQLTPPGSPCSVIFGTGLTDAGPGSVRGLHLIVSDVEAARADLVGRGVEVSEVFHDAGGVFHHAGAGGRVSGPDPERRSYRSFVAFTDPDGNEWVFQEIRERLPGRGGLLDVDALAALLKETEEHHGAYEATAPKHHWWDWYAAYIVARNNGSTPEEAVRDAGTHMATVLR